MLGGRRGGLPPKSTEFANSIHRDSQVGPGWVGTRRIRLQYPFHCDARPLYDYVSPLSMRDETLSPTMCLSRSSPPKPSQSRSGKEPRPMMTAASCSTPSKR